MRERLPQLERLEYQRRLTQEIENYKKLFAGRMSQDVPPVWLSAETQFADAIEHKTGKRNLYAYVANRLTGRPSVRVLGLGSGACGNELDGIAPLLKSQGCSMHLTCVDVNSDILAQAGIEAAACKGAMGIAAGVGAHRPAPRPLRCLRARTRRRTCLPA